MGISILRMRLMEKGLSGSQFKELASAPGIWSMESFNAALSNYPVFALMHMPDSEYWTAGSFRECSLKFPDASIVHAYSNRHWGRMLFSEVFSLCKKNAYTAFAVLKFKGRGFYTERMHSELKKGFPDADFCIKKDLFCNETKAS